MTRSLTIAPAPAHRPAMPDPDSLHALLCAALDGTDPRRLALLTALCLCDLNRDRDAALARIRREGLPPVFRL